MRLQKQQLAFLVACAGVSAKHIRRFLRDLKIISMFLFTFIIRNDFGQAMVLYLQHDPVYHNWHGKLQGYLYFMCF